MNKKIIIIGGVAGGATAAARLRRIDECSEIIMIERGEHVSFANCGLPYYIGGTISERDELLVQTVEGLSRRYKLDIRTKSEALEINPNEKYILIQNLITGEIYKEAYDKLILSPGAQPVKPSISGISEVSNLFTLRNIPDTDNIKDFIDKNSPKNAIVIGGGFIGVEMAENLHDLGLDVTLVEMEKQIMTAVDYEMAAILHNHLISKNIKLILNDGVKTFENNGSKIMLNSGKALNADLIILSIGVKPENRLAKEANLEIGEKGGIVVNSYLQTSDSDIYAIGDAVEVLDYINGKPTMIPLAWPANRQGRIVADHIYGINKPYIGTLGTSIAKVFDLTVASTGNNEKTLKKLGFEYSVVHTHTNSHAGYYPNANLISSKILFDPNTGKIFGAQAVGHEGVDKRIDVIATAIKGGLSVFDLPDLELAYAPPYSSAKDPVNILGYVASNVLEEDVEMVQWHEINEIIEAGGLLIDLRDVNDRKSGYIDGSINIPFIQLRDRLSEIPKDKPIYLYCKIGLTGYVASRIMKASSYKVFNLDGGFATYSTVYGNFYKVPNPLLILT